MTVLFTIPKPFYGHFGIIQENALQSWLRLLPPEKILLYGNDPSVIDAARRYHVVSIHDTACNANGTPYLHSVFNSALEHGSGIKFLTYINADCMLDECFIDTLQALVTHGYADRPCIVSAQRRNLPIAELLDLSNAGGQQQFGHYRSRGVLDAKTAMDIFICHPAVLRNFSPFLVGRPTWDQWLVWHVRNSGAAVIDASDSFTVYHQSHDYTHVDGGWREACLGDEAAYNRALAGDHLTDLASARTHLLLKGGSLIGEPSCVNIDDASSERVYYLVEQAACQIEHGNHLGALDYLDMLLVLGNDNVPHAQYVRALCFYHLGRYLEAKSALITEIAQHGSRPEQAVLFSAIVQRLVSTL